MSEQNNQLGMTLVEVMVALMITAFGVVVLVGLMSATLDLGQKSFNNNLASLTARSAMNFVVVNEINEVFNENGDLVINKYGFYLSGGSPDTTKTEAADLDGDGKVGRFEDILANPGTYRYVNVDEDYNEYRLGYQLEAFLDNSVKPVLPFIKGSKSYPDDYPEDLLSLRVYTKGHVGERVTRFLIPPFMR